MNFISLAARLASIDRSAVTFDPERCLHTFDKGSTCTACFEACPAQAIAAGSPPTFNPEQCQGCLACLPVCPIGAFRADDAVPDLLTSAARVENSILELVCSLHPQPELGTCGNATALVVRGCLAGLGAGAGMALAVSGFEHIIYRCDACSKCPWTTLRSLIQTQVMELQLLLGAWEKGNVPEICNVMEDPIPRTVWDAKTPPISRRDFFRLAAKQSKLAVARAIENGEAAQPRQPGRDRIRKLKAASALSLPPQPLATLPQSDFTQLHASEACTACGVCMRACPTESLVLVMDEEKKRFNLVFYAQSCIACGICVRSCAPGALEMKGVPPLEQVFCNAKPVLIQAGDLVRCERCNTLIASQPGTHLCPTCAYRRANPFGSKLPPGFKLPSSIIE